MFTNPIIDRSDVCPSPVLAPLNKLLNVLPREEFDCVAADMTVVPLSFKQLLYKQDARVNYVYFPGGGAVSIMKIMEDGATVEIATIGREGVVGGWVYFGERQSMGETLIQIEGGPGLRMSVEAFITHMNRRTAFYDLMVRYSQAMMSQIVQTTACNALHDVEKRCCRWLLISRDRAESDDLRLTHEFLSVMLGVRRPTVTLTLGDLEAAGIVTHKRGAVRIEDRARLEQMSCECYAAAKANFARLLPEIPGPVS